MAALVIRSKTYGEKICYFDDCNYEIVGMHVWCIVPNRKTFYAMTRLKIGHKKYRTLRMHQLFLTGGFIDHIDGNGLNNYSNNLRLATTQQNNFNVGLTKRNKTGYKGVYKSRNNKYVACIRKSGTLIHGGTFQYPIEAAKKYNELALIHYGNFAWLNPV